MSYGRFRRPDQGDRITRRDCDVEALAVLRPNPRRLRGSRAVRRPAVAPSGERLWGPDLSQAWPRAGGGHDPELPRRRHRGRGGSAPPCGRRIRANDQGHIKTNEKRIARPGPKQAWFKDPAEDILSVIQE